MDSALYEHALFRRTEEGDTEMLKFKKNYKFDDLRIIRKNYICINMEEATNEENKELFSCRKRYNFLIDKKDYKGYSASVGSNVFISSNDLNSLTNMNMYLICPSEAKVGEFNTVLHITIPSAESSFIISMKGVKKEAKEKFRLNLLKKGYECYLIPNMQEAANLFSHKEKFIRSSEKNIIIDFKQLEQYYGWLKLKIPKPSDERKILQLIRQLATEIPLPDSISIVLETVDFETLIEKSVNRIRQWGIQNFHSRLIVKRLNVNLKPAKIVIEVNLAGLFEEKALEEFKKNFKGLNIWSNKKEGACAWSLVGWDVMYTYVVRIEKKAIWVLLEDLKKLEYWMNENDLILEKEENDQCYNLKIIGMHMSAMEEASKRMDTIIEGRKYHYRDAKSKMYQKRHFFIKAGRDFLDQLEKKYEEKILVTFYPYIGVVQIQGSNEYLSNVDEEIEEYLKDDKNENLCETSEDSRVCSICTDTLDILEHQFKKCGHFACSLCFYEQVMGIKGGRSLALKCAKCDEIIEFGDLMIVLRSCFVTGSDLYFESYKKIINEIFKIVMKANYLICPNTICSTLVLRENISNNEAFCTNCGRAYCARCKLPSHPDTCEENQMRINNIDESLRYFIKSNNTANCPECFCIILKDKGCLHMMCTNCGIHFCWLCKFKAKDAGAVPNHISTKHEIAALYNYMQNN